MKITVVLLVIVISINGILASCGPAQTTGSIEEKISSSSMSSPSVDETLILTRSPSATIIPTRTVTSESTDQLTNFKVIEASCPKFVSKQEVDLDDGFIVFDAKYPNHLREFESVSILNTRTGELQEVWSNEFAAPTIHNISPDKTKYYYFDDDSYLHIRSVDGQEYPVAYWDTSWGEAVYWSDNESIYILPKDGGRDGALILLNTLTGSWEKTQPEFPSGLNSFFPYVSYNKDLSVGLYICGANFCLWDVKSGIDLSRYPSSSVNFRWREPERDLIALEISDSMYEGVGELIVIDEKGQPVLTTNFSETYPQSNIRDIQQIDWSPNGKFISIVISLEDPAFGTFMLIDLETKSATNYCIQVPLYSNIIWSPDSSKVLITRPIDVDEYLRTVYTMEQQTGEVVLVDIEESIAVVIFKDTIATGWMVLPD